MMSVDAFTGGSPITPAFDFDENGAIDADGDAEYIEGKPGKKGKRIGYAGKKYISKKGAPAGVSIIGDNRYTPGTGTDEASEIGVDALQPTSEPLTGRLSWEQLLRE
jgi:hypothetical protein